MVYTPFANHQSHKLNLSCSILRNFSAKFNQTALSMLKIHFHLGNVYILFTSRYCTFVYTHVTCIFCVCLPRSYMTSDTLHCMVIPIFAKVQYMVWQLTQKYKTQISGRCIKHAISAEIGGWSNKQERIQSVYFGEDANTVWMFSRWKALIYWQSKHCKGRDLQINDTLFKLCTPVR